MLTTNYIQSRLQEVAQERGIRLLFAIESGSRAWGMASPDSDYDVRFVYARDQVDYLSLQDYKEMIGPIVEQDGELDLVGWDIRKFLKHIVQSNPNVLEWINSPIRYIDDLSVFGVVEKLADDNFCPRRAVAHYLGIAKGAFQTGYVERQWNLKKFGYYLRPILAANYVVSQQQRNPVEFHVLRRDIQDREANKWIEEYLQAKRQVAEDYVGNINPDLTNWAAVLYEKLSDQKENLLKQTADYEAGSQLFRSLIHAS